MKINNGDMPSHPVRDGDGEPADFSFKGYRESCMATGMTKREEMAKDFLAAILASGMARLTHDDRISLAIKSADDLLKALDKVKGE